MAELGRRLGNLQVKTSLDEKPSKGGRANDDVCDDDDDDDDDVDDDADADADGFDGDELVMIHVVMMTDRGPMGTTHLPQISK